MSPGYEPAANTKSPRDCIKLRPSVARSLAATVVPLLLFCFGCGGADEPRIPVEGEVTVGSDPVAQGSINFFPTGGTAGPAAATAIVDGRYSFSPANGPFAGKHRVAISVERQASVDDPAREPLPPGGAAKRGPARRRSSALQSTRAASPLRWETECLVLDQPEPTLDFRVPSQLEK